MNECIFNNNTVIVQHIMEKITQYNFMTGELGFKLGSNNDPCPLCTSYCFYIKQNNNALASKDMTSSRDALWDIRK